MPQVVRGRGNGAKLQEQGSQATWDIPHLPVEAGSGDGDPDDQDSWPGARPAQRLLNAGIALADTKPTQAATDPVGESISRRTCGAGSRSTFIVPGKAGNRGHRDPLEGREVSPGQTCGYDTRGNSVFHYRVNVLAADSRAGVQSFGFPPVVPGPVPGAKLPGEEPDGAPG